MTSTVTWFAVGRSMRWPPLVGAPLVAAAVVLVARLAAGPDPGPIGVAGAIGQVLVLVSLAFVADDVVAVTAPGVPTTARIRLAIRLTIGTAVVVGAAAGVSALMTAVGSTGSAVANDRLDRVRRGRAHRRRARRPPHARPVARRDRRGDRRRRRLDRSSRCP